MKEKAKLAAGVVSQVIKTMLDNGEEKLMRSDNSIISAITLSLCSLTVKALNSGDIFENASDEELSEMLNSLNVILLNMYAGMSVIDTVGCSCLVYLPRNGLTPPDYDENLLYIISLLNSIEYDHSTNEYVECRLKYHIEGFDVGMVISNNPRKRIMMPRPMFDACLEKGCNIIVPVTYHALEKSELWKFL